MQREQSIVDATATRILAWITGGASRVREGDGLVSLNAQRGST